MLHHLLLALGLCIATPGLAQTASPVPTSYTLKAPADYDQYRSQVIETVAWLTNPATPFGTSDRAAAGRFLIEWISGSPSVSVGVEPYVLELTNKDPDLLTAFLGGWASYALQHPSEKDPVTLNVEAIKTVLTVYNNKGGRSRGNKTASELSKLNKQDKLPDWIKARLATKK